MKTYLVGITVTGVQYRIDMFSDEHEERHVVSEAEKVFLDDLKHGHIELDIDVQPWKPSDNQKDLQNDKTEQ